MTTPRRHYHPLRDRSVRLLSSRADVSDARGTVLIREKQLPGYGLRRTYAQLAKNQRRQEPEWLDTLLFLPQRDNVCASLRGVSVSRWGVALGRRRFATISRTNGSHQ